MAYDSNEGPLLFSCNFLLPILDDTLDLELELRKYLWFIRIDTIFRKTPKKKIALYGLKVLRSLPAISAKLSQFFY